MFSRGSGAIGAKSERRSTSPRTSRLAGLTAVVFVVLFATAGAPAQADPGDIGYQGPSFSGAAGATTGEKPESKLWWNDGFWWASLYDTSTTDYHIWRLNLATKTWEKTPTKLDDRPNTKADTLWDATSNKLYVSSHVWSESPATGHPARLYRYSYDSGSNTYSLDSGFPVQIHNDKAEATVIDKDSTGQLWATWVRGGQVWVNRSICNPTCNDATWGTPFQHPDTVSNPVSSDDISALVTFANNRVGLMWSDQNDDTMYFSIHSDAAGDTTWQTKQAAYGGPGTNLADDHINLKSLHADTGDRVYAAIKTSRSGGDPLNVLLRYDLSADTWAAGVFGIGSQDHTRPIIVLDTSNNLVHMFATADAGHGGGAIYRKTTSLAANGNLTLSPSGLGEKVLWDASSDKMNNVTSTKQNVNSTTGVVILASESGSATYWWNYLPLDGSSPPSNSPPVAVADGYSTAQETALVVPANGVLTNDTDADGDTLTAAKTVNPANGTVTLNADGSFTYTPNSGFTGTDTFKYRAADASAQSNEATVTITVNAAGGGGSTTVNPIDDTYVRSNAPTEIAGSATTIRVYTTVTHTYLKFTVPTLSGSITAAKLRLFGNRASAVGGTLYPVADDTWEEETMNWNSRPLANGSALGSFGAVTVGQWSELDLTGAVTGPGTYSFLLKDGSSSAAWYLSKEGASPPELVLTTGGGGPPLNSPPVALADGYSTPQDTALVVPAAGVLTNDTDADGDTLTAAKTANPANGSVTLNANGSFTYTPNSGFTGTDTFKYKAADASAQSNEATVTITVTSAGGGGGSTTVHPIEDAYVRSSAPNELAGAQTTLRVYKSGSSETLTYLKFEVPALAGTVTQAKLRLFVNRASAVGGAIYPVSDLTWQEETITWNTKPPVGAVAIATIGPVNTVGVWVEIDLTGAIASGTTYSFAIKDGSSTAAWYISEEGAEKPELVITTS